MFNLQIEGCRLCGKRKDKLTIAEPNIVTRIKVLFHIEIKYNRALDKLSKRICTYCISSVDSCWTFYLQVQKAQCDLVKEMTNFKDEPLGNIRINTPKESVTSENPQKPLNNNLLANYKDNLVVTPKQPDSAKLFTADIDNCSNNEVVRPEQPDSVTIESGKQLNIDIKPNNDGDNVVKTEETFNFDCDSDDSDESEKKRNLPKKNRVARIDTIFAQVLNKPLDPGETWSEYPWRCRICNKKFRKRDNYEKHPCYKETDCYYCVDCPAAIMHFAKFIRHVKRFHWERFKFHLLCQCDVCKRWFGSKKKQESHRRLKHPKEKPRVEPKMPAYLNLTCDLCSKTYSTRYALKQHKLMHSENITDFCSRCGKGFRNKHLLSYHMRRYHTKSDELFHCETCGKTCLTKCGLNYHSVTHTSERPFACKHCHKTFKSKALLRVHSVRHLNRPLQICEICGKTFKTPDILRSHRNLMHSTKKAYKCSFCEKTFKLKERLAIHERQHTGIKPYRCAICGKTFTSILYKTKHLKRTHKIRLQNSYRSNENKKEQNITTNDHNYACMFNENKCV